LPIANQNEFLYWFAFAGDLRSRLKGPPTADLNQLSQLLTGQIGEGTLTEKVQLLDVS
jgi:hypothetical protein